MGQKNSSFPNNKYNIQENCEEIINKNSFEYISVIGKGGFGKVWKVYHKKYKIYYAMKEMSKAKIIDTHSEISVRSERDLLSKLYHPFIINMQYAFQDRDHLYLILDLLNGGDLRFHLCLNKHFTEEQSKFIVCCIILSLEYIHSNNIIHRDLKPENLVFDKNGYLKLTDFGIAKIYNKNIDNSTDNSGTPGYMAPEVLSNLTHNFSVDYYALGIIAYELMFNKRPYNGRNRREIKEQIMSQQIQIKNIPEGWTQDSIDFINKLIIRKPNRRLGYNGINYIKDHPWLKYFNWKDLYLMKINSPYLPLYFDNVDNGFFEKNEKSGLITLERYLRIKKTPKYLCEFKLYEYYDRRKDQNMKDIINEENILSENDDNNNIIYDNKKNNIKIKKVNSKKNQIIELNEIIIKNSNKENKYFNPHMIYKVLEEKEKNGFSDEEFEQSKKTNIHLSNKGKNKNNNKKKPIKNNNEKMNYNDLKKENPFDILRAVNSKFKFSEEESTDDKPQI